MTHTPPQNVTEAINQGGIPQNWTPDQLEWLEVKHKDLGTRGCSREHQAWRLRWSATFHDLLLTIASTPKSRR
jgi:hypothetical protein